VVQVPIAYNEAYGTIRGTAHEMSVLGTSPFVIANENTSTNTLQKDIPHGYETLESKRNRNLPPPHTQAVQPEDQASSGIYETIPEEQANSGIYETIATSHLDNVNNVVDYMQIL